MMDATKYSVGYYPPPVEPGHVYEWPQKDHIEQAPAWCSVDLRDGNQSLIVPMSLEEKLEFYDMLVKIGFKEIEVGFPAASETEYEFLRTLIDGNRIPQDEHWPHPPWLSSPLRSYRSLPSAHHIGCRGEWSHIPFLFP